MKKWALGLLVSGASMLVATVSGAAPQNDASSQVHGSQNIKSANYQISVSQAACKAGAECTVSVKLDALGVFHLNKEYPHKVKVDEAAGVSWSKKEFGKSSGDFAEANEKSGTITLKFKAEKAGKVELSGKFKFAVCSEGTCNPSEEQIKLSVDVTK